MGEKLEFEIEKEDGIVKVSLAGHLDATNAPELLQDLKELMGESIKEIVFLVKDLEYISSAGVRTIIFAKQKIGRGSDILLIAPQDDVLDVMKMSGLDQFLIVKDEYEQ